VANLHCTFTTLLGVAVSTYPTVFPQALIDTSDLNFESTGETLSTSNCTNSILTQDKSAYWAPWMYFEHENGTIEDVKLALGLTA